MRATNWIRQPTRLRSLRLGRLELARFGRGRLPIAALIAILLLPLLYGALYLWSFWDPYGRIDQLPVALVNEDQAASVDGKKLTAGDDLTHELQDRGIFDWREVDAARAKKGLAKNDYYMTLTIPKDFSKRIASSNGSKPTTSALQVRTDDSDSYLAGVIAKTAFGEIRAASSTKASRGFYDKIFVAFSNLHDQTQKAAEGAGKLKKGSRKSKSGSAEVKDGSSDAKNGSHRLSGGLRDARDGSQKLRQGLGNAAQGSKDLSHGLQTLQQGTTKLAQGTNTLSNTVHKHADPLSKKLRTHSGEIKRTATAVSDAAGVVKKHVKELPKSSKQAMRRADAAAKQLDQTYRQHCEDSQRADRASDREPVPAASGNGSPSPSPSGSSAGPGAPSGDTPATPSHPATPSSAPPTSAPTSAQPQPSASPSSTPTSSSGAELSCGQLEEATQAAHQVRDTAHKLNHMVNTNHGTLHELASHADTVQSSASKLAQAAPHLADTLDSAVHKVDQLNSGAQAVARGSGKLNSGSTTLNSGIQRLASGANSLDNGIYRLSDGARSLDNGLFDLRDGAGRLDNGLADLVHGSGKLSKSLHDGVDKIPDYDKKERAHRSKVMSDPVKLANQTLHKAPNYGTGFAPYFIPLALWVGVMVGYMLLRPLNNRLLSANAPAWRTTLAGWLPAMGIGTAQIAALMSVLTFGLGLEAQHPLGVLGFLLLTVAAFGAILQFLNARFGPAGRVLGLALLMLQLTSAGGTYPVETSPGFFGAVHPYLPMSWVVDGLRRLISGGDMTVVVQACGVLAAFLVGTALLTVLTARKRQMWTLDRLHPELTL